MHACIHACTLSHNTGISKCKLTYTRTYRHTHVPIDIDASTKLYSNVNYHTYIKRDRQTDRQTGGLTHRHTYMHLRHTSFYMHNVQNILTNLDLDLCLYQVNVSISCMHKKNKKFITLQQGVLSLLTFINPDLGLQQEYNQNWNEA